MNGLFFCFARKTDTMANRTIKMEVIKQIGILSKLGMTRIFLITSNLRNRSERPSTFSIFKLSVWRVYHPNIRKHLEVNYRLSLFFTNQGNNHRLYYCCHSQHQNETDKHDTFDHLFITSFQNNCIILHLYQYRVGNS